MFKRVVTFAAVLGLAAALTAQQPKKGSADRSEGSAGILHPEMTVAADAGTYSKPMSKLGEKPMNVWTSTTVAAGVDGKPQPGKAATVVGEIIDLSCYIQLGKHGEKHVSCGKKCLQAGQPVGLLAQDGTVYMLMEEEHDPRRDGLTTSFRKAATDHLGHIMEVTGTEASVRGYRAIYVQGFVNQ
jgi:hypothetical protein